jgi:muramoyltetrapeptide carboxypeptidase
MSFRKPPALKPGDLIGLAAPSGAFRPEDLDAGLAELQALGYRVRVAPDIHERHLFAAGAAKRRLRELRELWADNDVKAIVCVRGGAGAAQLMPTLGDWGRGGSKAFVGCSDATFLLSHLTNAGLVALHGPMAAGDLARGGYDRQSFVAALAGTDAPYASGEDDLEALRDGEARGRLLGGCLSILASSCGTPWALRPDPDGTLLFLEDIAEPAYRIDRHLRQLRAAGTFDGCRGVVFGDMKGCAPPRDAAFSLEDVILDALRGLDVPVALGLSSGHVVSGALTLPFGVAARLAVAAGKASFEVLETATA